MSLLLWFFIFIFLIFILYLVSITFQKKVYLFFYLITKNKKLSISLMSILLLPGTVVHEVSHMLTAEILGVRTGEFDFMPYKKENSNEIRMGGIKIAKSDPVRRTIIGVAPVFVGLSIITAVFSLQILPVVKTPSSFLNNNWQYYLIFGLSSYVLFIISNTMFSSRKDLEQAFYPLLLLIIIVVALQIGGITIKISLKQTTKEFFLNVLQSLNYTLVATVIIDLIFLSAVKIITALSQKILGREVVVKQ